MPEEIQENPIGPYTEVKVVPINTHKGSLTGGKANYNGQVLGCYTFSSDDLPEKGCFYNIFAKQNGKSYQFPGWVCASGAPISTFQEKM